MQAADITLRAHVALVRTQTEKRQHTKKHLCDDFPPRMTIMKREKTE